MKDNNIPIISLFSGGGFMDMGFIKAGFDIIYTNEFNKTFANLHDEGLFSWTKENHTSFCPITTTESLFDITPQDICKSAFPNGKPPIWGIIGGPPCQDFSMNGVGRGFMGERGKMTQIFFNRIRKLLPSFFVMENVIGLIARKQPKSILDTMIMKYISDEYYVDRITLNALDYGVPQYRKRVFIIGLRKDSFSIEKYEEPTLENICSMHFPWPEAKCKNAHESFPWPSKVPFGSKSVEKPQQIPYELCVESCLKNAWNLPNGQEFFELKKNAEKRKEIFEGDTKRQSFKRLHRYRYSPTTCFGNNEVFLHPYENRRLTVREALRIQGVDDSYIWGAGRLSSKFKVISNGVPVPLAESVAKKLYEVVVIALKKHTKKR